ncbi:MAG: lycopene beta-cyclase, partial [Kiritimatiellia bacterium]
MRCEVAILGAGPAGTAAAAACARAGLDTIVVDPAVHRSWRPTYAAWYDELERVGLQHCVQNVYEQVVVHTTRTHLWDRAYARVNGDLLRQTLSSRAENDGARFVRDSATSASWGEVSLRSGRTITARVVLDATGGRSGLQHRAKAKLFQVAWGVVLDVQHGMDPNRAVFMDWSERHEDTPSFLYALPIGEGRFFV